MKIIEEIKEKYPLAHFQYKIEKVDGFDYPFHSLYVGTECIISIAEGYEPKTGKERKEIFDIVKVNLNLTLEN